MSARKALSASKQSRGLAIIAEYLGPKMGHDGPAPTGEDAAYTAEGPMLNPAWDWPGQPTPTVLLEGGPYDWAIEASMDEAVVRKMTAAGIFCEPYAGYALCLYPVGA